MAPKSLTELALAWANRADATARNATEYLLNGGLKVEKEFSPYEVLVTTPMYRLRRYFPDALPQGNLSPLVLVPPLMMMADVYDVAPKSSAVRAIHENGIDVWVVDFGRPEEEPGGMSRTVNDHILAVSDVVDQVRRITGRDVTLSGYSQGGMFSYQVAALRKNNGVDSIVAFGTPVDFRAAALPTPIAPISPESYVIVARAALESGLLPHLTLPRWLIRTGSRMTDPVKVAKFELEYFKQLHEPEKLLPGEQQRQFLSWDGLTAYSGIALAGLWELVVDNRLMTGGLIVGDRVISLADIECPVMTVVGEDDKEAQPAAARAIRKAAPRAEIYELALKSGHFGLVASSGARRNSWPRVAEWLRWRAGEGELPDVLTPADKVPPMRGWRPDPTTELVQSAFDLWIGIGDIAAKSAADMMRLGQTVASEMGAQLPPVNQIKALRSPTSASLASLLDEAAERNSNGPAWFYNNCVVRHVDLKTEIDTLVKRLLGLGLRRDDRVGLRFANQHSGLVAAAAVNRIGAIAVLLRPHVKLEEDAISGAISWLISGPEDAAGSTPLPGVTWAVAGKTSDKLPVHVVDLDKLDAGQSRLPDWYRPNPFHGAEPAFVVLTGEGDRVGAHIITNRSWAQSAFAVASAASLERSDTVYAVAPLHHPAGLVIAVGGALAAGARLALPGEPGQDTFWTEVRRYGVTHVAHTSTSLRQIADAPSHVLEPGSPIRLLIGSDVPVSLSRRVKERFTPAKALDFYISSDAEAVFANLDGAKTGTVGKPLPGTAAVKISGYDVDNAQLKFGQDGFGLECRTGETGMLVVKGNPQSGRQDLMRGLFAAGDAWHASGDLFSQDHEGDFRLTGSVGRLVQTAGGAVPLALIEDVLERISCVDLAAAHGVPDGDYQRLEAVVALLDGAEISKWDLESTLGKLGQAQRPHTIRTVAGRVVHSRGDLQAVPASQPDAVQSIWRQDADGISYRLETEPQIDNATKRAHRTSGQGRNTTTR